MHKTVSIILLSYKSGQRLRAVRDRLDAVLSAARVPYELIIVDDGSADGSFGIAAELAAAHPNVFSYELSKNFTSHYAIFAGLSVCTGQCAMFIADDEQQPYEMIVDMYNQWLTKGSKIIFSYRKERDDPWLTQQFAHAFYKIVNIVSDFKIPPKGLDFYLIDREVVDILNTRIHAINTTTFTELLRLGFSPVYLPYVRGKSSRSKSRWTFAKKLRLAKDWIISTSSFPITVISYTGIAASLISLGLILFYIYVRFFGDKDYWKIDVRGWLSTVILINFFSGLILLSLGIIAEYIYRIYEEVKARPGYIIKQRETKPASDQEL